MLPYQALRIVSILGIGLFSITPAVALPTHIEAHTRDIGTPQLGRRCALNDGKVKFEIEFKADTGYEPTDSKFKSTGKLQRGDHEAKFDWKEDDVDEDDVEGTNNPKKYFKFYTYDDDDDADDKYSGVMRCTLTAKKKPGHLDCLTHNYTLQGKYNWLEHSKYRHEEADLVCVLEGDQASNIGYDINTKDMPLQGQSEDTDGDDDDDGGLFEWK
ncbi:uncharacterized protein I303_106080 [Kwoniella dejecticola CBS 10117]|uniref:AA1-like domain-containing protein n=1 Tax=Kwoniella dejecticola CBS 10117 TaxID=1296121 RepID=A0A1A6A191_9TREE|nr:uncharacterized protein I303_06100 [Kwoniella dejecticola CBS 10117]OBR83817.1 hypothetical protein I303_06100 [Kwoniella dejecticola CBS 10117]